MSTNQAIKDISNTLFGSIGSGGAGSAGGSTFNGLSSQLGGQTYYDPSTGQVYISYNGPTGPNHVQVTWANVASIVQTFSKEDQVRLDGLAKDREALSKKKKLAYFKGLPSDYRQHVIDRLTWQDHIKAMDDIEEEFSQEEKDLIAKKSQFPNIGTYASPFTSVGNWYTFGPGVELPKDITAEDLIRAHLEATTEELIENRSE